MRSGLQNRKSQGHCLPEGTTLFDGAVRILTPEGGFSVCRKPISQCNFQVFFFNIVIKVPFQLPPGNIKLNIILHRITTTSLKYKVGKKDIADGFVLSQIEGNLENTELKNNWFFFNAK